MEGYELWLLPRGEGHAKEMSGGTSNIHISLRSIAMSLGCGCLSSTPRFLASLHLPIRALRLQLYTTFYTWEDNVMTNPSNPFLVTQLAWAYHTLRDVDIEISGWWLIFEKHPSNLSILKLLYGACLRKYAYESGNLSLLKFITLCAMRILSTKADESGWAYLNWCVT